MANVFENVLTATPPSNPITTGALATFPGSNFHFSIRIPCSMPAITPSIFPHISPTQMPLTNNTPRTNLPVGLWVGPPVLEHGDLGIPRIRLEALRDGSHGRRALGLAQQRFLPVEGVRCVEGGEAESEGEGEEGAGPGQEDGCHWFKLGRGGFEGRRA